jgi:hypothetical protein
MPWVLMLSKVWQRLEICIFYGDFSRFLRMESNIL